MLITRNVYLYKLQLTRLENTYSNEEDWQVIAKDWLVIRAVPPFGELIFGPSSHLTLISMNLKREGKA